MLTLFWNTLQPEGLRMPQLYRFDSYIIYFWVNEGEPTEPVHVHVQEGRPSPNGTKIWITRKGKTIISHNQSRISPNHLRQICRFVEANSDAIIERWKDEFDRVEFFC